jgi:proteasome lid subunit RPN8/RPN11
VLENILPELIKHGQECLPNEACGVVIIFKGKLKYIRCTNLLYGDDFYLDPEDYAKAESMGEVVGIAHTHVNYESRPSEADITGCNFSKVPWLIYSFLDNTSQTIMPSKFTPPLVGRVWYHGVQDCYTLIMDYYKQELGIILNDYPRQPDWWYRGDNLYSDNFRNEGFEIVTRESIKPHDLILMQNNAAVVNHGGIYLGDNILLHHCTNRLSSRDVYGGYWESITRYIIRHRSLM